MESLFRITAFYKFFPLPENTLEQVQQSLSERGKELDIHGLVITSTEGVNGTVAGTPEGIAAFKQVVEGIVGPTIFKDSHAEFQPFKRWFVKIRPEIVTLGDPSVLPETEDDTHVPPTEWNRMMEEDDVVIIDTRNTYETEIGMFEGAIDPRLASFQEFPDYVRNSGIPKEKKVMMYCTGGIRCEKALIEMKRQGYEHVYQLEGGILKYLEEFPEAKFQGECFVFDHRVAVNQKLHPSEQYKLCPHCGDPGDVQITCARCSHPGQICKRCDENETLRTCSKDCTYHFTRLALRA